MPSETSKLRTQIQAIHHVLDQYEGEEALAKICEVLYAEDENEDDDEEKEDPDAK